MSFAQFYNTKTGTVFFDYTSKGTATFGFAQSLNPKLSPNQIVKGQKVYDYDNMQFFSLTIDEALIVSNLLKRKVQYSDRANSIKAGIVEIKPDQNNPNQQHQKFYEIKIAHFPGSKEEKKSGANIVSNLVIRVTDSGDCTLALFKDNFKCSVPIGFGGYLTLIAFLDNLPNFITMMVHADVSERMKNRKSGQNGNGGNGQRPYEENIDYSSNYSQSEYVAQTSDVFPSSLDSPVLDTPELGTGMGI